MRFVQHVIVGACMDRALARRAGEDVMVVAVTLLGMAVRGMIIRVVIAMIAWSSMPLGIGIHVFNAKEGRHPVGLAEEHAVPDHA